jgi:hypothetical protein
MSSKETDARDRTVRERAVDAALAADRAGRDRLRALADQPAPDRDDQHRDAPNSYPGGRS